MKNKLKNKKLTKMEYRILISAIIILSIGMAFIITLSFSISRGLYVHTNFRGDSMHKTITEESKVLYIDPKYKEIKRGDIIHAKVFIYDMPVKSDETGELFVIAKRVIGLPNETISIQGDKVYINDVLLEEPYAYYSSRSEDDITVTLESDQYFIMGDNRMDSLDSRFFDISNIESILGVALIVKE